MFFPYGNQVKQVEVVVRGMQVRIVADKAQRGFAACVQIIGHFGRTLPREGLDIAQNRAL